MQNPGVKQKQQVKVSETGVSQRPLILKLYMLSKLATILEFKIPTCQKKSMKRASRDLSSRSRKLSNKRISNSRIPRMKNFVSYAKGSQ